LPTKTGKYVVTKVYAGPDLELHRYMDICKYDTKDNAWYPLNKYEQVIAWSDADCYQGGEWYLGLRCGA
jgi:hypothetical protein